MIFYLDGECDGTAMYLALGLTNFDTMPKFLLFLLILNKANSVQWFAVPQVAMFEIHYFFFSSFPGSTFFSQSKIEMSWFMANLYMQAQKQMAIYLQTFQNMK